MIFLLKLYNDLYLKFLLVLLLIWVLNIGRTADIFVCKNKDEFNWKFGNPVLKKSLYNCFIDLFFPNSTKGVIDFINLIDWIFLLYDFIEKDLVLFFE